MPKLLQSVLDLERCPHCSVDKPGLVFRYQQNFSDFESRATFWRVYSCTRCCGMVAAQAAGWDQEVMAYYPNKSVQVSSDIPERARVFLLQALESTRAPVGAIMLAASAVDAMLKAKNLKTGSLNDRIKSAAANHLITPEMADWAHDIRLDANDQRHADESAPLPAVGDAQKVIEFALALAQFMFVLPARVQRGRQSAQQGTVAP